jgi:thiol-disulfide isomerase/thioredoxin
MPSTTNSTRLSKKQKPAKESKKNNKTPSKNANKNKNPVKPKPVKPKPVKPKPVNPTKGKTINEKPKLKKRKTVKISPMPDTVHILPESTPEEPPRPIVFGHIYSNHCGYCIELKPHWKQLCSEVNDIPVRDIEATEEKEELPIFNETYDGDLINQGYPTIYRMKAHGQPVEYYQGPRTVPEMKKWLYSV